MSSPSRSGKSARISSAVTPSASISRTSATRIRSPRIQGRPPQWPGVCVIRSRRESADGSILNDSVLPVGRISPPPASQPRGNEIEALDRVELADDSPRHRDRCLPGNTLVAALGTSRSIDAARVTASSTRPDRKPGRPRPHDAAHDQRQKRHGLRTRQHVDHRPKITPERIRDPHQLKQDWRNDATQRQTRQRETSPSLPAQC